MVLFSIHADFGRDRLHVLSNYGNKAFASNTIQNCGEEVVQIDAKQL